VKLSIKSLAGWTLVVGLLAVLGTVGYDGWRLQKLNRSYPRICYEKDQKTPVVRFPTKRPRGWTTLRDISDPVIGAVLVSEDWAFFDHRGLDWQQIKESIEVNMRKQRFARGASTITQQVVRNVFLSQEKSLLRKAREATMAVMLERLVDKQRILEIYFNLIEWGPGVYGIKLAARHYFDKTPAALNGKEGAFLAMLLPSPSRYSISHRRGLLTRFAERSVERILDKMVVAGYLSREQASAELCQPLPFEERLSPGLALKSECEEAGPAMVFTPLDEF
jgi:monofunctional biosynthetic peptidoglycan transglycosylase